MSIPKPKYCGQNWLDMAPAEGGRICGGCNKLIMDFTKSTWREIEQVQAANNNAVCGMYTNKQLENWGQQPINSCTKLATTLALFASLASVMPAEGQGVSLNKSPRVIVHGCVSGKDYTRPLDSVKVTLLNTNAQTFTDKNGNYSLDITDYVDSNATPLIHYEKEGYTDDIRRYNRGDYFMDIVLYKGNENLILSTFYIQQPTLVDTVKHKIKRKKRGN